MKQIIDRCGDCQWCSHYFNNYHCVHVDGNQPLGHDLSIPNWCPLPDSAPTEQEAAEKLRFLMADIKGFIDNGKRPVESQLKFIWNYLSEVVSLIDVEKPKNDSVLDPYSPHAAWITPQQVYEAQQKKEKLLPKEGCHNCFYKAHCDHRDLPYGGEICGTWKKEQQKEQSVDDICIKCKHHGTFDVYCDECTDANDNYQPKTKEE